MRSQRLASLDGLRGLAALAVLLSHCMLLLPSVEDAALGAASGHGPLLTLLTYTPLHALWAGKEAVVVFFVLSGLVLTRAADSAAFSWRSYYPARLLRLYLPVAGAVVISALVFGLVPPTGSQHISPWLRDHQHVHVGAGSVGHAIVLLRGPYDLLPPLWSLRWEVLFSLLLPLAVFGASRRRGVAIATAALLLALTACGSDNGERAYLLYLPMFGLGAVMARSDEPLRKLGARVTGAAAVLLLTAALFALMFGWTVHNQFSARVAPVTTAGAALLVFAFAYVAPVVRLAETRPVQWLGRRSFSLYLVHYPVLFALAMTLGGLPWYGFALAVAAALLAADGFFRLVEGPGHRLAQQVKVRVNALGPRPVPSGRGWGQSPAVAPAATSAADLPLQTGQGTWPVQARGGTVP